MVGGLEGKLLYEPCAERSVGLLVPPSNPVAEIEIRALLGDEYQLYVQRLPVLDGPTLAERNPQYIASYEASCRGFGQLKLQSIFVACTGPQYAIGIEQDRELCRSLSQAVGTTVITASVALHDTLKSILAERIHLEMPYPTWLCEQAKRYWTDAGFEVTGIDELLSLEHVGSAYEITTDMLEAHLREIPSDDNCAVVLSGTGMVSLRSILETSSSLGMPILSTNVCGAKWMIDHCGSHHGSALYRQLSELEERTSLGGARWLLPAAWRP